MQPTPVMTTSPYDRTGAGSEALVIQITRKPKKRWVASRFNARTIGEDGRMIVWNTFTGSISTFSAEQREAVLGCLASGGVTAPLNPLSEYLTKRGYLVPEGTNELDKFRVGYARQQWRTDVLELTLLATEDCNFRCVYCYEQFERGTMRPEIRAGLRAMLEKRARFLKELKISWFGGEPLYGWEAVEDIAPFVKQLADRHGITAGQSMTTNGYLLTEERATSLLEWGCRSFQITVDGLPSEHDCKRVGRDGSPTYDVIMDNLRSMRDRKDRFNIAIRVNYDLKNGPNLVRFLESLGEDFAGDPRFKLRFRPVGKWGGERDDELDTCGVREQRVLLTQLRDAADAINLRQEAGVTEVSNFGNQVCYAARPYHFLVGADGRLMKCTVALDKLPENIVGRILPDGTMDINDEHETLWTKPYFETDSMCQSCYVLPTCQGATCPLPRIRDGERRCAAIKSELKTEMRYTLQRAPSRNRVAISQS